MREAQIKFAAASAVTSLSSPKEYIYMYVRAASNYCRIIVNKKTTQLVSELKCKNHSLEHFATSLVGRRRCPEAFFLLARRCKSLFFSVRRLLGGAI